MTTDTKAPSLREALEFYANPDNWTDTPSWDGDPDNATPKAIPILRNDEGHPCDCGDTARKALAALDASIAGAWRYEIKYGPEGEANYAWVYDDKNDMVCTTKTHHANAIVERMNTRATPPAPTPSAARERIDNLKRRVDELPPSEEHLRSVRKVDRKLVHALVWAVANALLPDAAAIRAAAFEEAAKPTLNKDDVEWVVNDIAELGIKIGEQFFFLYKGRSLVYGTDELSSANGVALNEDTDPPTQHMWRPVFKREFGECAHPINYTDPTKIGTVSLDDSDDWKPLPAAIRAAGEK